MNGYEYTRQLKIKIAESPTHTLDLSDAMAFIRFYGLRNLFNAVGDIRFVGQVAIDVLDRAISEDGLDWNANGEFCGECSAKTCRSCTSEYAIEL